MAIPTTRQQFKDFCLRQLGAGPLRINLSEDQVDDCVDRAIYMYNEYHLNGQQLYYFVYPVTNTDIANRYITLPENIIGAVRLFPIGDALNTNSLFNMRYQFVINDLYNISNVPLVPYYMVMNHIQFLEEMLVGMQPIRYNRHNNICYIDMDWTTITQGEYLVIECYQAMSPDEIPDIWKERWLQDYTIALISQIWGRVLSKFQDMPMPGQMKFNGEDILNRAERDIERLEKQLIIRWSIPPAPFLA